MVSHGGVFQKSGDNLLSRYSHYHRPGLLNGRVRNGNGCGHPGVLTGKFFRCGKGCFCISPTGGRVGAAKRLAVSTGRLKRLPAVHVRPIDLVVFQEPVQLALRETWSCGGFHA